MGAKSACGQPGRHLCQCICPRMCVVVPRMCLCLRFMFAVLLHITGIFLANLSCSCVLNSGVLFFQFLLLKWRVEGEEIAKYMCEEEIGREYVVRSYVISGGQKMAKGEMRCEEARGDASKDYGRWWEGRNEEEAEVERKWKEMGKRGNKRRGDVRRIWA